MHVAAAPMPMHMPLVGHVPPAQHAWPMAPHATHMPPAPITAPAQKAPEGQTAPEQQAAPTAQAMHVRTMPMPGLAQPRPVLHALPAQQCSPCIPHAMHVGGAAAVSRMQTKAVLQVPRPPASPPQQA
jgi:hypothetical protein